jgi:hypothetical protein
LDATISIEASARHLTNLYSHCMVQTLTKSLVPAASR